MLEAVYKMLTDGGPWGVVTLLLAIILWLARDNIRQRDSYKEQLQEQYQGLFAMIEKKVTAEVNHTSALGELRKSLENLIEKVRS